ncbi:CG8661 [Drosophila busckii]|uniref:CG8661 n=1 Tax=Drosophila busckii TaxID=30019 RepID=A0A0M3QYZ3_DROBS|nr:uncharacterized protein LOC108605982 [Drosophila busckii]ALC48469.1 CG8661 [Drosophila busckii]
MKAITLVLLVLLSGSCLLSSSHASTDVEQPESLELELALQQLEAELDDDYVDIDSYGFIGSVRKALKKALKSLRGVNCIVKEVTEILEACTKYIDAIDACGTQVPKDVMAIVNSCKAMIGMCNKIIHLNSQLCNNDHYDDTTDSGKMSTKKCSWQLFKAVMKLTRKLNRTIKLITKLPSNTSSCFVGATNEVKITFDNFLPNVNVCVDNM